MYPDFILLGAERQSAVSFALCYPEKRFLFISDQPVLDGWDIANVQIKQMSLSYLNTLQFNSSFISLSSRYTAVSWSHSIDQKKESNFDQLARVYQHFPAISLLITRDFTSAPNKVFAVKGDLWHKPDAFQTVQAGLDAIPTDKFNCGLFYQEALSVEEKLISTGRIYKGKPYLGIARIYRESIAREEQIIAAETILEPKIVDLTAKILEKLEYTDLFTFSWIRNNGKFFLTSVRPEPAPLVMTLKKAGIDLLEPENSSSEIAAPGIKMIGDIHYSSYQNLMAC